MQFEKGHIYHIYNQGNNRRKIFFTKDNYLYFLKKVEIYLLPFSDVIAYCLMPNHFHFMVRVNEIEAMLPLGPAIHQVTLSHPMNKQEHNLKKTSFNQSIAIMLRSYTRAINKQENFSGSLFRVGTKAECLSRNECVTPSFFITNSGTLINTSNLEGGYPHVCFNYIHQNPVKAKLVAVETEWEFSSARDYAGTRKGSTLVNTELIREY
jgi:putative transposase